MQEREKQAASVLAGAARAGGIEACMALLQSDRFVQGVNRLGPTGTNALHIAVWRNSLALVDALLAAGADPDTTDKESGWTALHRALYAGHFRVAAALLAANASLSQPDWRGRSPLDLISAQMRPFLPANGPGDVFAWGAGTNYALGTGSTEPQTAPARIDALHGRKVVSLSAAKFHSAAVTEDGSLFTWGFGRGGRLGHADAHLQSGAAVIAPRRVAGLGRRAVVAVAAAKHHTLLCTEAGEVWTMGSNRHGQLGLSAPDTQAEPRRVSQLRARVVAVAAANKHSVAVTAAGEVFSWGCNVLGQLGYGTCDSSSSSTPRLVEALKGRVVVAAAAAKRHTVALTADGDLFTWGHRGVSPRRVVLAGARDAALVAASGGGQGRPLRFHRGHAEVVRPTAVEVCAGAAHSSVLTSTGVVLTWRSADPALLVQEVGGGLAGKRAVSVSAGKYRTAAVTEDGDVYAWEGRSDFFPAEGRSSGSGSKKAPGGSRGGLPQPPKGRPIPPRGGSSGDPAGLADAAGSFGSWGSFGRPSKGGVSYMERAHSLGREAPSPLSRGNHAPYGASPGYSPSPAAAAAAASGGFADAFLPVVPEKVSGLKRAGAVAVGEKHSLALQRWGAAQLEGMPAVPWLVETPAEAPSGSDAEEEGDEGEGEEQEGSHLSRAAEEGASRGPLSLQLLCEEAVGRMLVDPRTALQVLEYADLAGAPVLRTYCLAVAICNLDAVLVEARGAFEGLPPHLMAEMELAWKTHLRSAAAAAAPAVAVSPQQQQRPMQQPAMGAPLRPPRRRLRPGLRPTAASSALGDLEYSMYEEPEATVPASLPLSPPPLRAQSSFKDVNAAASEQVEARLRRSLAKKLQQIEHLEAKMAAGGELDDQQRAKVAQRPVVASGMAALDAGTAPEEVAAMLQAAAEAAAEQAQSSSVGAPSGTSPPSFRSKEWTGDARGDKRGAPSSSGKAKVRPRQRQQSDQSVLAAEASTASVGASPPPAADRGVPPLSPFADAAFSSASAPSGSGAAAPPPTHVVGFAAAPAGAQQQRSAGGSRSATKPPRKGALSMFLRGELDGGKSNGGGGIGGKEGKDKDTQGPAWGGMPAAAPPATSLKQILDREAAATTQQPATSSANGAAPLLSRQTPKDKAIASSTPKPSSSARGIPLAAFLTPKGSSSAADKNPTAAPWGGVSGASPPVARAAAPGQRERQPSLREIQEEQELRRAEAAAPPIWGVSPPSASRLLQQHSSPAPRTSGSRAAGRGSGSEVSPSAVGVLGSSPGTSVVLGSSPSGRVFLAPPPPPQSKWYVPEEEQRRKKSLKDIQTEESAMKELAKRYGGGNVRISTATKPKKENKKYVQQQRT